MPGNQPALPNKWERIAIFGFGVLSILEMILIAVIFPEPTEFQYIVFRIVLALSVAGVGALIPGSLDIQHQGFFRAGGDWHYS